MKKLLDLSGTQLAELIRSGETTSQEVVETHINHIEEVNPTLNAVVRNRFREARDEARRADELAGSTPPEKLPPFHGVPCTIKESFAVKGMPHTSGLVARKHVVASADATAVDRLKKAGAIVLGVTNVSELCMWMESNNHVYGRSNNPYDPERIVGGSSGGEGAIIGAGGVPFGLGADIGGSIRLPAFFNGVFGHKPTGGLVPNTGQYPIAENQALRYLTTGPLTRRAEDLMPLLNVLAGPDQIDTECASTVLGCPDAVEIGKLTVLDVSDNAHNSVSPALRKAQRRCADALAAEGARVIPARFEHLKHSLLIWTSMLSSAGGTPFGVHLGNGQQVRIVREIVRWCLGRSPHTLPAIALALIERLSAVGQSQMSKFIEMGRELRQELVEAIGPSGVMLYPSYVSPAPKHNKPLFPPFNWVYTAIINVMELPSTQVPVGLDEGLSVGVQVIGIHNNDHVTIAVAKALEAQLGGWVPPPASGPRLQS